MEDKIFNFPFQKIDKARRVVVGVATADNVDPTGDRVEFEASLDAFEKWVGNMREMHGKNAVGRSLAHRPTTVVHDGKTYRGIEVEAYISKGAEDTWQKVLDGTLRGFSIGGGVVEKSTEYDNNLGRKVNVISKYNLGELSLVDDPCNPAAMFSMVKMANDGVLEETTSGDRYQIFYCPDHKMTKAQNNECYSCDIPMVEIGYADEFSMDVINKMVTSYFEKGSRMTTDITKGACADCAALPGDAMCKACKDQNDMAKVSDEEAAAAEDAKDGGEDDASEDASGKKIKKSTDLLNNESDDKVNDTDISIEKVSLLKSVFDSILAFAKGAEIAEVVEPVEKVAEIVQEDGGPEVDITELTAALSTMFDEKLTKVKDELSSEFGGKLEAITKSVEDVTTKVETVSSEVTEKVATIEGSGAIKKSADGADEDGEITEVVEKTTFWGGMIVPLAICNALGYDS